MTRKQLDNIIAVCKLATPGQRLLLDAGNQGTVRYNVVASPGGVIASRVNARDAEFFEAVTPEVALQMAKGMAELEEMKAVMRDLQRSLDMALR